MNSQNPNGRINIPGTDNIAQTVSPKVDGFYANIEIGIMPVVKALISRGYHPVSSCGGHFYEGDNREVTLAFPDICTRYALWEKVCEFEFVTPKFWDQFFNVGSPSKVAEIAECNRLFGTKWEDVVFLTLWILPYGDSGENETLWVRDKNAYADAVCHNTVLFVRYLESAGFPAFDQL